MADDEFLNSNREEAYEHIPLIVNKGDNTMSKSMI